MMETVNAELFNSLVVLSVAALNALGYLFIWLNGRETRRVANATHVVAVATQQTMKNVERQTNGLTAALVVTTGQAERALGKEEGRAEGEVKAAGVIEGRQQQADETAASRKQQP